MDRLTRPRPSRRERAVSSALWLAVSLPLLVVGVSLARETGFWTVQALIPLSLFAVCVTIAILVPARWRAALSDWLPPG